MAQAPYLSRAVAVAREAGQLILQANRKSMSVDFKSAIDPVTEVDIACEKLIVSRLQESFPDHKFLCEETAKPPFQLDSSPTWIVDPIDGTTNFVHGIPVVAVSIGLWVDSLPVVGVVYNPLMDECFTAERTQGAHLNDRKLNCSGGAHEIAKAVVCTGIGYDRTETYITHALETQRALLTKGVRSLRVIGSAALSMCYVACGRFDCYYEHGVKPWDTAAGCLVIQEAGGSVTMFGGQGFDLCAGEVACFANPALSTPITACISPYGV